MNVWTPGSAFTGDPGEDNENDPFSGYPVKEVVLVQQPYGSDTCVWRVRWEGCEDLHWINNVYAHRENLPELAAQRAQRAKKKGKKHG